MELLFEWDEEKAELNLIRHQISFDEGKTVFSDKNSITVYDSKHSQDEERYIDIGLSNRGRLLVVVYTEREQRIRLSSCRKATISEQQQYERNRY